MGNTAYTTDKLINDLKVPNNINLGVMVNAGDLINNYHYTHKNLLSLFKKRNKKIKFVRLACHFDEIQKLKKCLNWLNKNKYEVFVNIMQISEIDKSKVRKICNFLIRNKIKKIYLADSLGSLRIKSFKKIINIFQLYWPYDLGLHAHNNLKQALENSVYAIKSNFKWIDSTIMGMGRGPGNLLTEDIIKKYYPEDLGHINRLKLLHFKKLKTKYNWGPNKYYKSAAIFGIHPTYIQEMLSEKRYKKKDYENILKNLKKTDAKKYNPRKLFVPSNVFLGSPKGKWTPKSILNNKKVLLLGPGKSIEKQRRKIEKFVDNNNLIVVSINSSTGISRELINFRLVCHPLRIISDAYFFNRSRKPLIMPYSMMPKKLSELVSTQNKLIYDFGLKISKSEIVKVYDKFCISPSPLAIIYALSVCKAGQVNKVYLAGFDGYQSDDPATDETAFVLKRFRHSFKNFKINTITPSKYNLEKIEI